MIFALGLRSTVARASPTSTLRSIRQILSGSVWPEVVNLPYRLMAEARRLRDDAPIKAALKAQKAVAIALLTFAPIRCGNLASIKLEENLIRPGGPDEPFWLIFPKYDVKNRIRLEFPLDESLTALIEEYLYDHRPALLRGSNQLWLFPDWRQAQEPARAQRTDHGRGREGDRA